MTKDMTNGSPMKLILGFSVPLLFGFLFQQFYNLMDTLIVGRFLGVDDLAAVGSTGSVNFLIIGFCMGVCNGFAIPLAHKFGAGDYKGMRGFMMNAIYLSAIFAVVMTIVTVIFCMPILELMRTPENIIDGAYRYIVIIFWGIPVTYLYNLVSGIIRSMGDSRTPVVFLVIAAVINIGLDLFFIVVLGTGVEGAAWATVISQLISCILVLWCLYKSEGSYQLRFSKLQIKGVYLKQIFQVGIPAGIQSMIINFSNVLLQSSVNSFGSTAMAGYTAATGPAFSDMAYDLKCGYILRGNGADPEFERAGRKQQYISEIIGFIVAFILVAIMAKQYFSQGLFAPVDATFAATIEAGAGGDVAKWLLIWAIPGAIIQFLGGSRQVGILFATGLLVGSTINGLTILIALLIRYILVKKNKENEQTLNILGAGSLAGAALYSFFTATLSLGKKK